MIGFRIQSARFRRYAVWAICAAPVVLALSRSNQSTSYDRAPGQANFDRPPREREFPDGERERGMRTPVTEEEWKKAGEFLSTYSKVRYNLVKENIGRVQAGERERLKRVLVYKWRSIVALERTSPELYKTKVQELVQDDRIFGDCLELRKDRNNAKARADLNAAVSEDFELGLTERKQRIGIVEKSLVVQKKSLDNDEKDKARLVQQEYENLLAHGVEGARLGGKSRGKSLGNESSTSKPAEDED